MGEFDKNQRQDDLGQDEKGEKPAFGQFDGEKGQGKDQSFGQDKQQFGQDKQQFGQDKQQFGQDKQDALTGAEGGQQQFQNKEQAQRQQGDEDLGEDSKDDPTV